MRELYILIVVAVVNIGTAVIVGLTLWRLGKILKAHPAPDKDPDQAQADDSWHSWRFWLPAQQDRPGESAEGSKAGQTQARPGSEPQ